jgi:hypothetical protein
MPSVQLSNYLQLRADGETVEVAAERSGIGLGEARLHEDDIAAGDLPLPPPSTRRTTMARGEGEKVKEVAAPDFAKMKRIFLTDLKPANEQNAKSRGDLSAAWGAIEKDCHCNKRAAKLLFKLNGESEETRDDFLRTLYGGMKALGIGISADLVDKMSGDDAPTMPVVDKSGGMGGDNLATLNSPKGPDPDAAAFGNDTRAAQPAA